jgi:hypothetical protein
MGYFNSLHLTNCSTLEWRGDEPPGIGRLDEFKALVRGKDALPISAT